MSNPRISITPIVKQTGSVKTLDPVDAYTSGYSDAISSIDGAIVRYVTTLRLMGWKDQDILKALLMTIHSYSIGSGIDNTMETVLKNFTGKEKLGNNGK